MITEEQLADDAMVSVDIDEMSGENITDDEDFGEEANTDDSLGAGDEEN